MGLPSKKRTNRSKRDRASHFALKAKTATKCAGCGATTLPHRACTKCGAYKGKAVVNVQKRALRLTRSKKGHSKKK